MQETPAPEPDWLPAQREIRQRYLNSRYGMARWARSVTAAESGWISLGPFVNDRLPHCRRFASDFHMLRGDIRQGGT